MEKIKFEGVLHELDEELRGTFNTFRHGPKWTKLRIGEVVELTHFEGASPVRLANSPREFEQSDLDTEIGRAVVIDVSFGQLGDMLLDHAVQNYETDDEGELAGVLADVYGAKSVRREAQYTVVHLVRLLQ